jgi:hypothetical protein
MAWMLSILQVEQEREREREIRRREREFKSAGESSRVQEFKSSRERETSSAPLPD